MSEDEIKVLVYIDVQSFTPRAYLQRFNTPIVPTDEFTRLVYGFMGGRFLAGDDLGPDIFPILSAREKKKVYKVAGQIGFSGPRGSMLVGVSKKKLEQLLKEEVKTST